MPPVPLSYAPQIRFRASPVTSAIPLFARIVYPKHHLRWALGPAFFHRPVSRHIADCEFPCYPHRHPTSCMATACLCQHLCCVMHLSSNHPKQLPIHNLVQPATDAWSRKMSPNVAKARCSKVKSTDDQRPRRNKAFVHCSSVHFHNSGASEHQ